MKHSDLELAALDAINSIVIAFYSFALKFATQNSVFRFYKKKIEFDVKSSVKSHGENEFYSMNGSFWAGWKKSVLYFCQLTGVFLI